MPSSAKQSPSPPVPPVCPPFACSRPRRPVPLDSRARAALTNLLLPLLSPGHATPLLARTALLLHGPSGVGKTRLLTSVGQGLNCHVLYVDTRTLLRPSDVATAAAFRAILSDAQDLRLAS